MKTRILISALAVVLSVGTVAAQTTKQVQKEKATTSQTQKQVPKDKNVPTENGPLYVDKNNNGVCDNYENGTPRNPKATGQGRLLDGSGVGRGQAIGKGQGNGRGRAIGPRDGRGQGQGRAVGPRGGEGRGKAIGPRTGQGRGPGKGAGLRNGKGYEENYVDANKNGVCDRREQGAVVKETIVEK